MRKKRVYKKFHQPDVVHGRVELGRFINYVMKDGKKSTAEKLVYGAFDKVKEITKEEPMVVFERALENVMPLLEVDWATSVEARWRCQLPGTARGSP